MSITITVSDDTTRAELADHLQSVLLDMTIPYPDAAAQTGWGVPSLRAQFHRAAQRGRTATTVHGRRMAGVGIGARVLLDPEMPAAATADVEVA